MCTTCHVLTCSGAAYSIEQTCLGKNWAIFGAKLQKRLTVQGLPRRGNEGLDDVGEVDLHEKQLLPASCRLMTMPSDMAGLTVRLFVPRPLSDVIEKAAQEWKSKAEAGKPHPDGCSCCTARLKALLAGMDAALRSTPPLLQAPDDTKAGLVRAFCRDYRAWYHTSQFQCPTVWA